MILAQTEIQEMSRPRSVKKLLTSSKNKSTERNILEQREIQINF